jgi:glycosyltransferase involved in cell wall biosynthesis
VRSGAAASRAAVIYDVHEDVPRQILAKSWMPALLRRPAAFVAEAIEGVIAPALSAIVAATPPIARRFPGKHTVTVQNFVEPSELALARPTPYAQRDPIFTYIGAVADVRGAAEMVDAIGRVPVAHGARLVLAGLCNDALRESLARRPGWARTAYLGWLSRPQVAEQLGRARAGLLLIHPTRNYLDSYPSKAFEYMAAGLPLIVSDFPFWRELFEDVGCAIFVNPLDPDAIARAMTWVLEHPGEAEQMGAKGIPAARTRFNWEVESAKLVALYGRLTGRVA